jgi:hypothetical protein
MIIYSIIPLEQIVEGIEKETDDLCEINMNGVQMQVKMINEQQAQIVRLISPNPQDFLNASYAPGSIIQFHPAGL